MRLRLWLVGLLLRRVATVNEISASHSYVALIDERRMTNRIARMLAVKIHGTVLPVAGDPREVVSLYKIA